VKILKKRQWVFVGVIIGIMMWMAIQKKISFWLKIKEGVATIVYSRKLWKKSRKEMVYETELGFGSWLRMGNVL